MERIFKIYGAYDCDDWQSWASMNVSEPIIMTTSLRKLTGKLRKYSPKDFKQIGSVKEFDTDDLLINKFNSVLNNVYVIGF